MQDYRLYRLDPITGHFTGAEDFHASDDAEAVCLIHERVRDAPMELWRGRMKLAHYEAEPEIPEPLPMMGLMGVYLG